MANTIVERCDFNIGEPIGNDYHVTKILGEGSFGKVYQVKDAYGNDYALKLLRLWEVSPDIRETLIKRFEVEFKTGQIDCEYLVKSFKYDFILGNPYIVMEFCPGGDLTSFLGKVPLKASTICQQILLGLHALHIHGKVHRDLKPENILFKKDGTIAITDFGIIGDKNNRMTRRNFFGRPDQMFGTYAYMPPEQINRSRGGVTVLPTTDIFSFGVLTYQLLTNQYPFGSLTSHNELAEYQRKMKEYDWNSNILRSLPNYENWYKILSKCLCPNFKERFQSVEEIIRLLPEVQPIALQTVCSSYVNQNRGQCLRVLYGEEFNRTFNLTEFKEKGKNIITVGREDNNVIQIQEHLTSYVSRNHCCIELNKNGSWILRDGQWQNASREWKSSSNGTFINSTEVSSLGVVLHEGDIITIGETKLRFENF